MVERGLRKRDGVWTKLMLRKQKECLRMVKQLLGGAQRRTHQDLSLYVGKIMLQIQVIQL